MATKDKQTKAPDPAAAKPSDIKDAPDNAEHVATIPETKQGLQPGDLPTGERSHPR